MYIITNAIKNLGRNRGRNILLAIIIFAIILTASISIIINTTTSAIIEDYKSRFGAEVTIAFDVTHPVPTDEMEPPTVEQFLSFGESDLLHSSALEIRVAVVPKGLHGLDESGYENDTMLQYEPTARLIGYSREDINDEFAQGQRKITEGRAYQHPGECLVSRAYAQLNGLSVGDTITLQSCYIDLPMPEEMTIAGIYEDTAPVEVDAPYPIPLFNRGNEILASFDDVIAMELAKDTVKMGFIDAKYILKDPALIGDFEQEVRGKGLSDQYLVFTDETRYNTIVRPVEGLKGITNTFLLVVLGLGAAVLIILSVLSIRERKYEIGVLRAMGMKKGKVALGLLTESLVITALCLCLGLGIGSAVAQPISDSMLQSQVEIAELTAQSEESDGLSTVDSIINPAKPLSEVEIHMGADAVVRMSAIALALAGVSSLVGIWYLTRWEPMKILSERG